MFHTAAEIKQCADDLIAKFTDLPDVRGDAWTQENFKRLDEFVREKDPRLNSHYCKHSEKAEFLWDFIAAAPEVGIFLAAESEQGVANEKQVQALKHDFEKLLYVYSPLRMLITKARDRDHAAKLADTLAEYAHGCCLSFNPGAVFILHFGLWNSSGNVNYIWQCEGEPNETKINAIRFDLFS